MIKKETARQIFNCYSQLEAIDKLKKDMCEEIEKVRQREEERKNSCAFEEPIPENSFGKFGKGLQLGIPDEYSGSMRIFNISPELGICVMDEQRKALEEKLKVLETIAKLEMQN